jgi:hypothetical protein
MSSGSEYFPEQSIHKLGRILQIACQAPIFLYGWLAMKTTMDLPDDLLIQAKALAARRRISLKDMVTHALRREIMPETETQANHDDRYETGPFGILRLKKRGAAVTEKSIRDLSTEADEQDFQKVMKTRNR